MFKTGMFCLTALLGLSFILCGCAGNLPENKRIRHVDEHWGYSYESIKLRQTLNPEAGVDGRAVKGLDGRAAVLGLEAYRETFEKRTEPTEELSPGLRY